LIIVLEYPPLSSILKPIFNTAIMSAYDVKGKFAIVTGAGSGEYMALNITLNIAALISC